MNNLGSNVSNEYRLRTPVFSVVGYYPIFIFAIGYLWESINVLQSNIITLRNLNSFHLMIPLSLLYIGLHTNRRQFLTLIALVTILLIDLQFRLTQLNVAALRDLIFTIEFMLLAAAIAFVKGGYKSSKRNVVIECFNFGFVIFLLALYYCCNQGAAYFSALFDCRNIYNKHALCFSTLALYNIGKVNDSKLIVFRKTWIYFALFLYTCYIAGSVSALIVWILVEFLFLLKKKKFLALNFVLLLSLTAGLTAVKLYETDLMCIKLTFDNALNTRYIDLFERLPGCRDFNNVHSRVSMFAEAFLGGPRQTSSGSYLHSALLSIVNLDATIAFGFIVLIAFLQRLAHLFTVTGALAILFVSMIFPYLAYPFSYLLFTINLRHDFET
jgi:hypothetical protein